MDQTPITLEGVTEKAVAEAATGDLMVEGWLARYNDPDRAGEYFMPGAFQRAVDAVKAGRVPLLYQHREGAQLGQITELEEKAGGVWMKAVVPKPVETWAADVYDKLKRGMVSGLSAKGVFTKMLLPEGGAKIRNVDLWEGSVTPVPVGASAAIEVVAQKALDTMEEPDLSHFDRALEDAREAFAAVERALEGTR